jgi:succinyl-diaminopimelate desuccinylase
MSFDKQWVLESAKRLIRIPSRGGVDDPLLIVNEALNLAQELELPAEIINDDNRPLGVWVHSCGKLAAQKIALIACIDTSGFDETGWKTHPTDPVIESGWLCGRGSADSKTMAVLFLNLAKEFQEKQIAIEVFLDADEHTGHFRGTKAFAKICRGLTGGYIGYPGADAVNRGARGFYRVRIRCEGKEGHSGSHTRPNAVTLAGQLAQEFKPEYFERIPEWEGRKPQWTVTGIKGGGDWGRVPERCDLELDVRLTKVWDKEDAKKAIEEILKKLEVRQQVVLEEVVGAPPYAIPADHPLVTTLIAEARKQGLAQVGSKICGPSNVGNFFAQEGVPMVCGWGARYKNMHAPNECICLDDLPKVYEVYRNTLVSLISQV